jgi:hypothetical protein
VHIRTSMLCLVTTLIAMVTLDATSQPIGRRRAVLVGINDYTASTLTARPKPTEPSLRDWPNLSGAVNDVEMLKEMLVLLYDFQERDVVTLIDQSATRGAILGQLERHLAAPAAKGDVLLFYFGGHGSQVLNSLSDESDKLDESIVPADSRLGALDIRDKELRPLFNRILDRGAALTVILDNCHSGSGARGLATGAHPRGVGPDLRDVADGADYGPRPEDRGALVLAATQDSDAAWETRDEQKKMHGAFSWAWIRAMRDSAAGESASETFARAAARLRAERPYQEPVLAGNGKVELSPFLGIRKDRRAERTVIAVEKVRGDGTVVLQGGWANGLAVGSELRVWNAPALTARMTITTILGLGRSEGRISAGRPIPRAIRSGALMEVVGWVAPAGRPLRIWMPHVSDDLDTITTLARKLSAAAARRNVRWIKDPTDVTPTHLLRRGARAWELLGPSGQFECLGPESSDAIAGIARIPAASTLFVQLPAPAELIDRIDVGPGSDREGIEPVERAQDADYILVGRYCNGRLAYAWVRPAMRSADGCKTGLPLSSAWREKDRQGDRLRGTVATLREDVVRLRKIQSWHLLESPAEARFGYRLGLRRERDGQWARNGAVIGEEKYSLFLRASKPPARRQRRFVYVFTIDSHGNSFLLFGTSSVENRFPLPLAPGQTQPPAEISLGPTATFDIAPPYGIDTYFLLTTDEPLPNPRILEWDGVRAGGSRSPTALEALLLLTGTGSRARRPPTPSTWSIERVFFEAVPPREAKTSG